MKILLLSYRFYPDVGGIESVSQILADEFHKLNEEIIVVTKSHEKNVNTVAFPYEVIRSPSLANLFRLNRWADIVFHNNISLTLGWPSFLLCKAQVITHHTWISRPNGEISGIDRLKISLASTVTRNISISRAIAEKLPVRSVVIQNPYKSEEYYRESGVIKHLGIVFVGRLVSDKGVDILLHSIRTLKLKGLVPQLTIVGTGQEESRLRELAVALNIHTQTNFTGMKCGSELREILNAHTIMVVPSRWNEPFGIVALEGIACGCVVVGSGGGGLKDAIGPCGLIFRNGDSQELAKVLARLLVDSDLRKELQSKAVEHLKYHQPHHIAKAYLQVLKSALK